MVKQQQQQEQQQQQSPDELDALLQRMESTQPLVSSSSSSSHRKSLSLFVGPYGSINTAYGNNNKHGAPLGRAINKGHRKNKSSISELYDAIRSVDLQPLQQDFKETSLLIRQEFVQELQEMKEGYVSFFDMGMTRSLSILPEDIPDLHKDAVGETSSSSINDDEDLGTSNAVPLFQYIALFFAVFAVSSKSTGFHMLDHVNAPLKQYWKMVVTSLFLLPFCVHAIWKERQHTGIKRQDLLQEPQKTQQYYHNNYQDEELQHEEEAYTKETTSILPDFSPGQWMTFFAAMVAYSTQNVLFVKSLEFTTVGNACIYANSQALLLILGKACVGDRVHVLESLGVVIAFAGAALCTKDAEEQSNKDTDTSTKGLWGDGLALLSACAGVLYLTFAKAVRATGMINVTVFVFSVMFFGSFLVLLFLQINSDGQENLLTYDTNKYHGVFGWLNMYRLPILLYMAVVVNMIGTMGFVRAMQYFDNVVIAVATLMEPLLASLIAFGCHAGLLVSPTFESSRVDHLCLLLDPHSLPVLRDCIVIWCDHVIAGASWVVW